MSAGGEVAGEPFPVHVADVTIPFRCVDAGERPGQAAAREFDRAWPSYRRWFLHQGEERLPSYAECRDAVRRLMPEIFEDYQAYVAAVGGGDLEARFLSHWCPPPLVTACSIAVTDHPEPLLVRNYDYPPVLCDALAMRSHWSGRSIIGMADCGWGLMDGVNADGLAIAIAFGGRREVGVGFGIGLVVRYLLQVCTTTEDAVRRLASLPVRMSYNVVMTDAYGDHATVFLSPDRAPRVTTLPFAANRQGETEWPSHAHYSGTIEREEYLASLTSFPLVDPAGFAASFLRPPLFRPLVDSTWGTVYSVAYEPATGAMTLLWPDDSWPLSVHGGDQGSRPRTVLSLLPNLAQLPVEQPSVHPHAYLEP